MSKKGGKKFIIPIVLILVAGLGVVGWLYLKNTDRLSELSSSHEDTRTPIYSKLTGLEIADASIDQAPTCCIQIPNGSTDGARPQVGLQSAAVVFEAIAETGITRFAAIFQDPAVSMIGPIRSLRPYYLDWDTPFDCTIVHDGGSDEALASVGNGQYRNLDENFTYMWKENYISGEYRYWNNVFTSPQLLGDFNTSRGYTTSNPQVFPRLTPDQAATIATTNNAPCDSEDTTECLDPSTELAAIIRYTFTGLPEYNVIFTYDPTSNTYFRFNEDYNGNLIPHESYLCAANLDNPPAGCTLEQISPSAIAIMRVRESTMDDGYHESIQTIGSGQAYIFQNGQIITGEWQKSTKSSQITFTDTAGNTISFTPGQLWIAAVPQFGSVNWE